MKLEPRFRNRDREFWANVRSISERFGYTQKRVKQIKVPSLSDVIATLNSLDLDARHIYNTTTKSPTPTGMALLDYFSYRADVLNNYVEPRLMDVTRAAATFARMRSEYNSMLSVPMNKQKNDKRAPAYLTGIVNTLIEGNCEGIVCNYSPSVLTTFTKGRAPLRTLARRVDGCFPGTINPVAVWEIKEYYYTTTFGSRVADGVYESLLDGLELEELREHEGVDCQHILIVDAYLTWWSMGRSYLCRMIDMLHMGYVDEVLFGYEVVECLPGIVKNWVELYHRRMDDHSPQVQQGIRGV